VSNLTQMLGETVGGVVHVLDEHPVHSVLHPSSHSQARDLLITNIVHVWIHCLPINAKNTEECDILMLLY
jgi:hypothetical protein